jgi:hypothetical protein
MALPGKRRSGNFPNESRLKRRDLLKMGLAGVLLSGLNRGCENKNSSPPPNPSDQVYELTDGTTLYDDFDGQGCLQTYNDQNLAEAGKISSGIWAASAEGAEVVDNPLPESVIPRGMVLKLASGVPGFMGLIMTSRRDVEFKDCRRLCGDIMIPSSATGTDYWATVDYHTTIPEQPPGVSWFTELGIRKSSERGLDLFAQCINRNTEYRVVFDFGTAEPDTWYSFRMDVVTQRDDPSLAANQLRIDYYINGELKGYDYPWDGELLLNPERTGSGPDRYVRLLVENPYGESIAYFDNIRAAYSNRIR